MFSLVNLTGRILPLGVVDGSLLPVQAVAKYVLLVAEGPNNIKQISQRKH